MEKLVMSPWMTYLKLHPFRVHMTSSMCFLNATKLRYAFTLISHTPIALPPKRQFCAIALNNGETEFVQPVLRNKKQSFHICAVATNVAFTT